MSICFSPAYYFEQKGFNPTHQPKNALVKELSSRIIAIASPIFYAYQFMMYLAVSVIDLTLALVMLSPGILCQKTIPHIFTSGKGLLSSLVELPQKIIFGPHCHPNYFGINRRYEMANVLWEPIQLI